jgi:uncharacterized protein
MRSSDLDLIFVAGLGGSGADHWQTRWRAKLPTAVSVEQANWDRPMLAPWTDNVVAACSNATRPILLIAHSLGVATVARAAPRLAAMNIKGAFLVAPPSDAFLAASAFGEFGPNPRAPLPFPALVVAGSDDLHGLIESSRALARDWGAEFIDAGAVGHINVESGHGPWPEGLMSLAQLLKRI